MAIVSILQNTGLQLVSFLGGFLVCGAVMTVLSRWTGNTFRQFLFPGFGLYAFGVIGIPIHELSHAFFCKLFGHKVHKVKWFDGRGQGGSHGAVTHSWNPRNIYHQTGRFFIGLAPVLLGPALILGLLWILIPETRLALQSATGAAAAPWQVARDVFGSLLTKPVLTSVRFYVFLYLATAISSQMELSREDMIGSLHGFIPIALLALVANILFHFLNPSLHHPVLTFGWTLTAGLMPVWLLAAALTALNLLICFVGMNLVNWIARHESINPFRG